MLLNEVVQNDKPVFAWLEPAAGPNNVHGVRLTYIELTEPKLNNMIDNAKKAERNTRAQDLEKKKEQLERAGKKFHTPNLGWWMNEQEFHDGREGVDGITKGFILAKYPNLQVLPSKEQAMKAAKKAGLI